MVIVAPTQRDAVDERLERIYATEFPRLASLGRLLCRDLSAGEDLAQDAFLTVTRLCRRDPGYLRDPAWPWLRTTLVRLAMQRRRTLARELARLVRAHEPASDEDWPHGTLDLLRALSTLPPRLRACTVLFYVEDMSTADIASIFGSSPRTVETQLREARRRLAPLLRDHCPDSPPEDTTDG